MKKKLLTLSLFVLSSMAMNAQTTLFEDSFEAYADFSIANVGNWTLTDVDLKNTYGFQGITFENTLVQKAFIVFNSTTTSPPMTPSASSNWTARTGNKAMVCFASTPANNDWLISPQIQLGASGNTLTFWAKSCDTQYGQERFKVGVSTTGTATTAFTMITPSPYVVTPATAQWVQYTYNLDAYQGQNVYIAINCVSNDQFGFAVDDFKVTATTLGTQDFFAKNFAVFPNPANDVLHLAAKNNTAINGIQITDLNGRIVKSLPQQTQSEVQINIADLTTGAYFISVQTNEGTTTSKFLKN